MIYERPIGRALQDEISWAFGALSELPKLRPYLIDGLREAMEAAMISTRFGTPVTIKQELNGGYVVIERDDGSRLEVHRGELVADGGSLEIDKAINDLAKTEP